MWPCMKLRHLEEILQSIDDFEQPKVLLEQYMTPSHLVSHMIYTIQTQYGDIRDKVVADLGCGCGALTIGAAVLEPSLVVGFEIDSDALNIFSTNVDEQELNNVDCVQCDVVRSLPHKFHGMFDTVLMNPPFGTKHNAGIDMKFLETATLLSNNVTYSLHKTSTRKHVLKQAKILGTIPEVIAELRYDLPATLKFHRKSSVDVQVDLIRLEKCK